MDGARVHVGLAAWLSPEHSARSPNCLRAGQAALAQDLPGGPAPTDSQEARPGTERCPEPHRGPAGVPGPVTHVRTCQAPGHAGCGPVVFAHQATCFAFSSQAKPSWEQPAGNSVAGQGFPGRLEAQQDMFGCEFALQNHLPQSGGCRSAQGLRAGPGLLTPAFCRPAHPHSPLQACSPPPPLPSAGLLSMVDLSAQAVIYEVATVTYMVSALHPTSTPIVLGRHRREQAVTLSQGALPGSPCPSGPGPARLTHRQPQSPWG